MYLWRAIDAEGEVLKVLIRRKRDTRAAPSHAQAPEKAGVRTDGNRHGSPAVLRCRVPRTRSLAAAKASGRTTGRRAPTFRPGDDSGGCRAFDRRAPPSAPGPLTPLSTTLSTSADIWSAPRSTDACAARPSSCGAAPPASRCDRLLSHDCPPTTRQNPVHSSGDEDDVSGLQRVDVRLELVREPCRASGRDSTCSGSLK